MVVLWVNRPARKSPYTVLVFVGAACNAIVTIVNGGKMPVLGQHGSPVSVWRAARLDDHVLILCDRFSGFSIGDMLIGAGLSLLIGSWLWKRNRPTSKLMKCQLWGVLLLAFCGLQNISASQDTGRCEQSTVKDAWGPKIATEARSFLIRLQSVVKATDRKQFSSLVHYPVRILQQNHSFEIFSPSDFVDKYSAIVTPEVKHAILAQSPDCLFGNGDGMMVGRGQVWFQKESSGEMKIVTINPHAPVVAEK